MIQHGRCGFKDLPLHIFFWVGQINNTKHTLNNFNPYKHQINREYLSYPDLDIQIFTHNGSMKV